MISAFFYRILFRWFDKSLGRVVTFLLHEVWWAFTKDQTSALSPGSSCTPLQFALKKNVLYLKSSFLLTFFCGSLAEPWLGSVLCIITAQLHRWSLPPPLSHMFCTKQNSFPSLSLTFVASATLSDNRRWSPHLLLNCLLPGNRRDGGREGRRNRS